jgi:plastocyanin
MKRLLALGIALVAVLATGSALAESSGGKLVIRHQVAGCHSWSFNGNAFSPSQVIQLRRGATITVVNDDVMPHRLVRTAGPAVTFAGNPLLSGIGATVKVTFTKAGTYRFTTKAGEDYAFAKMTKTVGKDNVLRLMVRVG